MVRRPGRNRHLLAHRRADDNLHTQKHAVFLSFRYVYPEPALANDDRFVIGFTASRTKKPALEKR
jgi:hypothetical protein